MKLLCLCLLTGCTTNTIFVNQQNNQKKQWDYAIADSQYFNDAVFIGSSRMLGLRQDQRFQSAMFYTMQELSFDFLLTKKCIDSYGYSVTILDALKQQIQTNVTAMNFQDVISCPTAENQLTEPDFAGIASQIYTEPVNATLDPDNGYSVVASKNGTSMDADSAKAEYESAEENTDITIPFTFTEPEITTEKMNANLFKDTLGSYSSSAAGGTSGRIHNVGLTASICNGQIVLPGETFSFNGVVGDTTAEKGYQEAAGYQDGKVVQVLGGGECQVSSTLFSAILYTDLDVLERANHSMPVHYVPSGMDATVFWDSPDFKFENNHKYPVKIVMNMDSSDTLTVKILGTKENDYTIEPRVEQIDEMSNVTYRDYKDASGNVVKSESVCASKYKPLNSGS